MRLIDADELKGKIEIDNFDSPMMNPVMTMTKVLEYIDEAPTVFIPTAELDTTNNFGEWKPDGTCSECGMYSSMNKDTVYFCPNCGADMRKKVRRMSDEEKFISRCMCSICAWRYRRDEYCHCPFYYEEVGEKE